MTRARFSYSEIRGSKLAWQLPAAYRSLQRPSSASSAKASTGCPLQLAETMLALAMEFSRVDVDPIRRLHGPPLREAVRFAPGPDPAEAGPGRRKTAAFKAAQCAQHKRTTAPVRS